MKLMKV